MDFEKSYEKVYWYFTFCMFEMKDFPTMFIQWTKNVFRGGNIIVLVNDDVGLYFTTRKGLRHGDTSAPLLLSNVDDIQTTMTKSA
jgi:hypothetical protein